MKLFTCCILLCATFTAFATKVKVQGEGYMRFERSGGLAYAKQADLTVINQLVCCAEGFPIVPHVAASGQLSISLEGEISSNGKKVGQIVLALFTKGQEPAFTGNFGSASSKPKLSFPGDGLTGIIAPDKSANTSGITVRATTEVEGETITLADLADFPADKHEKAKAVFVDRSPIVGQKRTVDAKRIAYLCEQHGLKTLKEALLGAPSVIVTQKSQIVTPEELIQVAQSAVGPTAELIAPPTETLVAIGKVSLIASTPIYSNNRALINVEIQVNGKRVTSKQLQFKAERIAAGTMVKVLVRCKGIAIETTGKVISMDGGLVVVETPDRVRLTGKLLSNSTIEVQA